MKLSITATTAVKVFLIALTVSTIGSFIFHVKALLLKYPPVWPDEALFANVAINLIHRGELSMDIFSGTLLGIGRRAVFMPPLYYFYLASIFHFWGPGIVVMRLSSLAAALAVIIMTYGLGLRSGLGRWLSLVPVCFLVVDKAFLRAAILGRMEMLSLAFMLVAFWLAMDVTNAEGRPGAKTSFLAGLACASAALTHPLGAAAAPAVVGARTVIAGGPRRRVLAPMLAGLFLPVSAWAVYISLDWKAFASQFGGHMAARLPPLPHSSVSAATLRVGHMLHVALANIARSGPDVRTPDEVMTLIVIASGFAGLCLAAIERKETLVLPLCQPMILPLVVFGRGVYLLPLTAVGLAHLIHLAKQRIPWRMACATGAVFLCSWFGLRSFAVTSRINYVRNVVYKDGTNYFTWCQDISRALPSRSQVLISVIPDPYFCLIDRPDLKLREFLDESVPIDPQRYQQYMADADYVIIGPDRENPMTENKSPSPRVNDFAQSAGKLIAVVGTSSEQGYFARIYKVAKRLPTFAPGP